MNEEYHCDHFRLITKLNQAQFAKIFTTTSCLKDASTQISNGIIAVCFVFPHQTVVYRETSPHFETSCLEVLDLDSFSPLAHSYHPSMVAESSVYL